MLEPACCTCQVRRGVSLEIANGELELSLNPFFAPFMHRVPQELVMKLARHKSKLAVLAASEAAVAARPHWPSRTERRNQLLVGFLSADFEGHVVGQLTKSVFRLLSNR